MEPKPRLRNKKIKTFQCDVCGATLKKRDSIIDHLTAIHPTDPKLKAQRLKCELCDSYFENLSSRSKHFSHFHMCSCGYKCKGPTDMQIHKLSCNKNVIKEFLCLQCDITFLNNHDYKIHINTHHRSRKCEECGKILHKNSYKKHLKIHQSRQHQCEHCQKLFLHRHVLNRHINEYHQALWLYFCDQCGRKFKQKAHLKKHSKKVHPTDQNIKEAMVKCDLCECHFYRYSNLMGHMRIRHGKIYNEEATPNDIIMKEPDKIDMVTMALEKSNIDLTQELDILTIEKCTVDGRTVYKCNICSSSHSKFSNLKRHHMTIHRKLKPFKCPMCELSFNYSKLLRQHLFTIHKIRCQSKTNKDMLNEIRNLTKQNNLDIPADKLYRENEDNIIENTGLLISSSANDILLLNNEESPITQNTIINEKQTINENNETSFGLSMPLLEDQLKTKPINQIKDMLLNNIEESNKRLSVKCETVNVTKKNEIFDPNLANSIQIDTPAILKDALLGQANAGLLINSMMTKQRHNSNNKSNTPTNKSLGKMNTQTLPDNDLGTSSLINDDYTDAPEYTLVDPTKLNIIQVSDMINNETVSCVRQECVEVEKAIEFNCNIHLDDIEKETNDTISKGEREVFSYLETFESGIIPPEMQIIYSGETNDANDIQGNIIENSPVEIHIMATKNNNDFVEEISDENNFMFQYLPDSQVIDKNATEINSINIIVPDLVAETSQDTDLSLISEKNNVCLIEIKNFNPKNCDDANSTNDKNDIPELSIDVSDLPLETSITDISLTELETTDPNIEQNAIEFDKIPILNDFASISPISKNTHGSTNVSECSVLEESAYLFDRGDRNFSPTDMVVQSPLLNEHISITTHASEIEKKSCKLTPTEHKTVSGQVEVADINVDDSIDIGNRLSQLDNIDPANVIFFSNDNYDTSQVSSELMNEVSDEPVPDKITIFNNSIYSATDIVSNGTSNITNNISKNYYIDFQTPLDILDEISEYQRINENNCYDPNIIHEINDTTVSSNPAISTDLQKIVPLHIENNNLNCRKDIQRCIGLQKQNVTASNVLNSESSDVNTTTEEEVVNELIKSFATKRLKRNLPHKCKVCLGSFGKRSDLLRHEKTHSENPKVLCPVCGKCTKSETAMKQHMTLHESKEKLECLQCHKRLAPSSLRLHKCYNKSTYKCPMCDETFKYASTRKIHIKKVHIRNENRS